MATVNSDVFNKFRSVKKLHTTQSDGEKDVKLFNFVIQGRYIF